MDEFYNQNTQNNNLIADSKYSIFPYKNKNKKN